LPAAWCGIVGFKPSHGRVPVDPFYLGRCAGPMTRTVEDAALAMAVLARADPRDATALPPEAIDWTALGTDLAGRTVGLMLEPGCGMAVDPQILSATEAAARHLERRGARIRLAPPLMDRAILDGIDDFWRCRSWGDLRALPEAARSRVLPYILAWASAAETISGVRAVTGFNRTYEIRRRAAALFGEIDLLVSPVTPVLSFPAEAASPLDDPQRPFEHIVFTLPWNMGEQPAVALNAGLARCGAPIGVQIVGPRLADLATLAAAR
ncbi:amidase family protein, partial [Methylobrevis pamukkalensis]|uniref:amidase family protein n=1 Tax=Methylobrevis pamukkalensis TaxID=1439726 RepID=UPI001FD9E42F